MALNNAAAAAAAHHHCRAFCDQVALRSTLRSSRSRLFMRVTLASWEDRSQLTWAAPGERGDGWWEGDSRETDRGRR